MNKHNIKGFSLIEMLLVMVIISMVLYMGIGYIQQKSLSARIDRTSMQMQQILNAGLAYYVINGSWPTNLDTNLRGSFLPNYVTPLRNPWGQSYTIASNGALFYVVSPIVATAASGQATAVANVIAGTLPMSYTTTANGAIPAVTTCGANVATCKVVASVNIPGQNLNNARAVNYAGLYHHGACVPAPTCPVDANGNSMVPQIMLVPVSVSGVNDANNPTQIYPISSFTAYATGSTPTLNATPPRCNNRSANPAVCYSSLSPSQTISSGQYWRACLQVVTSRGEVKETNTGSGNNAWGKDVTLMAITRCAISNENTGSNFTVFTR